MAAEWWIFAQIILFILQFRGYFFVQKVAQRQPHSISKTRPKKRSHVFFKLFWHFGLRRGPKLNKLFIIWNKMILMALFFQTQLKIHNFCWETVFFFIPDVTPKLWRSSSVCRTTIMFHLRGERSQKTKQSPLKRRPHTLIRLSRRRRPKYTNSPQIFGLMRLLKNQGMTKNETRIPTSHLLGDVSSFL